MWFNLNDVQISTDISIVQPKSDIHISIHGHIHGYVHGYVHGFIHGYPSPWQPCSYPSFLSFPLLPFPSPLRPRPLKPARGSGECKCKLPKRVRGRAPAAVAFWCIVCSQNALLSVSGSLMIGITMKWQNESHMLESGTPLQFTKRRFNKIRHLLTAHRRRSICSSTWHQTSSRRHCGLQIVQTSSTRSITRYGAFFSSGFTVGLIQNVDELRHCYIIKEWAYLDHQVIDNAVKQWNRRLRSYAAAKGGHFEQML